MAKTVGWRTWLSAGLVPMAVILLAGAWARADAPAGRYAITADTVTDTRTGLTWQRAVSPTRLASNMASGHCTGGWRLPRKKELQTLVDVSRPDPGPAIDVNAFPNTPTDSPFWTSTAAADGGMWTLSFLAGETMRVFAPNQSLWVRCVR